MQATIAAQSVPQSRICIDPGQSSTPVADADASWLCPLSLPFFGPKAFCGLGAGDRDAAIGPFAVDLSPWLLPDTLPRFTVVLLDFLSDMSLPYSISKPLLQLTNWSLSSTGALHGADNVNAVQQTPVAMPKQSCAA